jgi:hypothetical protein
MRILGSDNDGVTDISLEALEAFHEKGKELVAVGIHSDSTSEVVCTFYFKNDEIYNASGFSIGYSGTGPHGLYKAIKMWDPKIGPFEDTKISSMDTNKSWMWFPIGGFREAEFK